MGNVKKFGEYEPVVGQKVFIADSADVIGRVEIGDESNIWFQTVLRGDIHEIKIGKRTNIQDLTCIHLSTDYGTYIGDNVTIGHSAIIHGCRIEDNVLVGMGACILDGAVIPKNCIVGARSLVTMNKTFEEGSLIIGSPARSLRRLSDEEIQTIQDNADHYVEYAGIYLKDQS